MTKSLNRYSSRITATQIPGRIPGDAVWHRGMTRCRYGKGPGGYQQRLVRRQHLQHASERPGRQGEGVVEAGLVGLRFNTIGVSDGISMGTEGMSYSLPSRDLIADSIETVMRAQWYDANISLPGCDKNMPGCLIAMARLNRPALMVYGGTIRARELRRQAGHRLRLSKLR